MIFLREMLIRKIKEAFRRKQSGFTLLETLAATGIASIVITSALGLVGSIYFSQKRVQFSQDFYAESRYLMERIAQIFRNNTIDYDRFFIEMGPNSGSCPAFDARQAPAGANLDNDNANPEVNRNNRIDLSYPGIFYWDTNGDTTQDRNLGGMEPDGTTVDDCTEAWDSSANLATLYLINSSRTLRTAIRFNDTDDVVEVQRQLGADVDGDGLADVWGPHDANDDGDFNDLGANPDVLLQWDSGSSECEIITDLDGNNLGEQYPILGDETDEDFCDRGHDYTIISPLALKLNALVFKPGPSRDPFLNFRVDAAQVHPHVFIYIDAELRNPDRYGFEAASKPFINFQSAVSSRVFGNIRR